MDTIESTDSVPTSITPSSKKNISLSTGPTIVFFTALFVTGYLIGRGIEEAIRQSINNRKNQEDE